MGTVAVLGRMRGVFFHQVRGIREQQSAQFLRRRIGKNRAAEAAAHQARQVTCMVEVSVRKHDPVERSGIFGQGIPVALAQFLAALKQSAVHQQALAICLNQIFRSGDGAGRTEKSELGHRAAIVREVRRFCSAL